MGTRGQPPVREAERRRRNAPAHPITKMGPDDMDLLGIDTSPTAPDPAALRPSEREGKDGDSEYSKRVEPDHNGWHPYVTELWERLKVDPSKKWNGPGAIALDLIMCENLSRLMMPRVAGMIPGTEDEPGRPLYDYVPMNGSEMAAVMKWASARGLYESDRLRIHKEIEFHTDVHRPASLASVTELADSREELFTDQTGS